jgi:hypothetical protein
MDLGNQEAKKQGWLVVIGSSLTNAHRSRKRSLSRRVEATERDGQRRGCQVARLADQAKHENVGLTLAKSVDVAGPPVASG